MNAREQFGHMAKNRQAWMKSARVRGAISPCDKAWRETGSLGRGDIDNRIPAEQRRGSRGAQRAQCQQGVLG